MGDIMYTVEKIEDTKVTLEDRETCTLFDIDKNLLPQNINEGDIIDIVDNKYVINIEKTNLTKKGIRNRFNSLMN